MEALKSQMNTLNREEIQKLRSEIATRDSQRAHIIKRVEGLRG